MWQTIFILILFFANIAHAADSWIHVVGIDENNPQQNHSEFYRSAQDFEDACKGRDKNCVQFLNTDPKLTFNAKDIPKELKTNGSSNGASKMTFSVFLEAKLIEASKTGESVVISLQDHGAPVKGRGSCIGLSSNELFCADDMKQLLQKYPKAKVLISANACYSGGFADFSSPNACVLTYGDRLHYSYGGSRRSLWNSVVERKLKTAADIEQPIFREIGAGPLLGSQQILQQLCEPARKTLGNDSLSKLSVNVTLPILQDMRDCRDPDNTPQKAAGLAKEVFEALSKSEAASCDSLRLPKVVCQSRQRLMMASSDVQQAIPRLREIAAVQETLPAQFLEFFKKNRDPNSSWAKMTKALTPEEMKEISDSIVLDQKPDWKKFTTAKRAIAQQAWNDSQPLQKFLKHKKDLEVESDGIISKLKEKGYYEDMMTVQSCLFESSEELPGLAESPAYEGIKYYNAVAKSLPVRKFTEKDYEDARKCESSFQF